MSDPNLRSHAAHRSSSALKSVADVPLEELPSQLLQPKSEELQLLLEQFDDVIFSAVRGEARAIEQAHQLWPRVIEAVGWQLVEEAREQYLKFAVEVTLKYEGEQSRRPEHAVSALEIISLLTRS